MITPSDINANWALLENSTLQAHELRVREMDEIETSLGRALFAVDGNRYRHLLIPIAASPHIREDKRSAGVQVIVSPLLDNGKSQLFIDVCCLKPHLNQLFSIIVSEILNLLLEDASPPDLICQRVLNRWRELLQRGPSARPSLQTVTGLFGELWQLREVVRRNSDRVNCWVGPTGARHDLVVGNVALEVKTSRARQGRFLTINGHDQLEAPAGGQLYLAAMKVEIIQNKGETLSDLLDSIIALGGNQYTLYKSLFSLGMTPDVVEACDDTRFRVMENRLYEVNERFPRIVSESFKGAILPNGVLSLSYQIDLSTEPPLALNEDEVKAVYKRLAFEGTS